MNCKKEDMLLYAVTDRSWTGSQSLVQQIECALEGGVTCIQLREKHMDSQAFLAEAREVKALCRKYHVPFLINDNVEVALQCDADGVHVGQSDMAAGTVRKLLGPDKILGVSVQTLAQAIAAEKAGADYLGVGAVFPTTTKLDACEVPRQILQEICRSVKIPVVAIGGINMQNIAELSGTGVDGAALISAIFSAKDITVRCRKLAELSRRMIGR